MEITLDLDSGNQQRMKTEKEIKKEKKHEIKMDAGRIVRLLKNFTNGAMGRLKKKICLSFLFYWVQQIFLDKRREKIKKRLQCTIAFHSKGKIVNTKQR